MTVGQFLHAASQQLLAAGITTPRLDTLVLMEDQLHKDRAYILAHPEALITSEDKDVLITCLRQRTQHMPLAYIRGKSEFYGREFIITTAVLQPRPESETMIELLLTLDLPTRPRIVDVGTGSGALGITAQLELPDATVELLDIDQGAIEVAKLNVVIHTLSIPVIRSDLLKQAAQNYDILLCNLPYVPDEFHINTAALHEPKIALFGGPDGLDIYRALFADIHISQHKPLYILTEALPPQHEGLRSIAEMCNYRQQISEDFIQVFTLQSD
ncbi:MAG: HemK/PrmC family methyltransferase [Candidatus Saccharibacteria bacterium]